MEKKCTLSIGKLPSGGLPRNSVVRITDCPDMTSAVYRGRKATNRTNKQNFMQGVSYLTTCSCAFILISMSFCDILVMFRLTTNLSDVHYNQCFEESAGHVFI